MVQPFGDVNTFFGKMPRNLHIPKVLHALKNAAFAALARRRPFRNGRRRPPPLLVVPPPFSWPLFPSPAIPARRPSPKNRAAARNSADKNGNAFFAISAIPLLRRSGNGKRLRLRFPAKNQKLRKNSAYMFSSARQFSRFPHGGKSGPKTNVVPDAAIPYPFTLCCRRFQISAPPI